MRPLELAAINALHNNPRFKPWRYDPHHSKRRKYARGNSPRTMNRPLLRHLSGQAVSAQQTIERYVRRQGRTWRELEYIINKEYGGRWNNVEPALTKYFGYVRPTAVATV